MVLFLFGKRFEIPICVCYALEVLWPSLLWSIQWLFQEMRHEWTVLPKLQIHWEYVLDDGPGLSQRALVWPSPSGCHGPRA